jgi:hypothetical protein
MKQCTAPQAYAATAAAYQIIWNFHLSHCFMFEDLSFLVNAEAQQKGVGIRQLRQ